LGWKDLVKLIAQPSQDLLERGDAGIGRMAVLVIMVESRMVVVRLIIKQKQTKNTQRNHITHLKYTKVMTVHVRFKKVLKSVDAAWMLRVGCVMHECLYRGKRRARVGAGGDLRWPP
jgi:hypothetical protein